MCGSKVGNQDVEAARAVAKSSMFGRIGNASFSDVLLKNLKGADVDSTAVEVDLSRGLGMNVAILQDKGKYRALMVLGSNLDPV